VGVPDAEDRWNRIADDLLITTGQRLVLDLRPGADHWWDCDVFLDDKPKGSFGTYFPEVGEGFVVQLTDYLCGSFLHEEVWGGWPICPDHRTHPLVPSLDDSGMAVWKCPEGPTIARIGSLSP
jgi:hypothetical protein